MTKNDISASIVTYGNDVNALKRCVRSLLNSDLINEIYIIDNSPTDALKYVLDNSKINYLFNNANLGYSKGHNIAFDKAIESNMKYHLVINPDIYFEYGTLETLIEFMESDSAVGLVMPKVLYPDGQIQHLCKLLPSPFDLFRRRFLPNFGYLRKLNNIYELRFTGYQTEMEVPCLSGCFMCLRVDALKKVGLFDERFFIYLEDVDLSRRINRLFKTVYYPKAFVYHCYEKASYKSGKLLKYHVTSSLRYFSKWGYFFDKERRDINKDILKKYAQVSYERKKGTE